MIPNFLNKNLDEKSVFALLNAIYFNAKWEDSFGRIAEDTFTKADGTEAKTPYLYDKRYMDYIHTEEAEGVVIPYNDDKTVFVALRPTDGKSVKDFATSMDAKELKYYISKAEGTQLEFRMPEFETYSKGMDFIDALKEMGLTDAFNVDTADFTDMCVSKNPQENVYINLVQQDTRIKVMRNGTEAAAVTIVGGGMDEAPCEPEPEEKLYLDSPYVYVVMDLSTQAPLFAGVMENPEAAKITE